MMYPDMPTLKSLLAGLTLPRQSDSDVPHHGDVTVGMPRSTSPWTVGQIAPYLQRLQNATDSSSKSSEGRRVVTGGGCQRSLRGHLNVTCGWASQTGFEDKGPDEWVISRLLIRANWGIKGHSVDQGGKSDRSRRQGTRQSDPPLFFSLFSPILWFAPLSFPFFLVLLLMLPCVSLDAQPIGLEWPSLFGCRWAVKHK